MQPAVQGSAMIGVRGDNVLCRPGSELSAGPSGHMGPGSKGVRHRASQRYTAQRDLSQSSYSDQSLVLVNFNTCNS